MRNFMFALSVFLLCCQGAEAQSIHTYKNPVIAGDLPDPTVIRVGNNYYAAGTSSDFAPNYPLYESTDLINWKQIGHIFNELPSWTSDSFWAPELYYKDGTFFVYYTAKRRGDRVSCIGVGTTKDIHKGFTDHGIIIEWGNEAIDAFIFQDENGKNYISWKAHGLAPERPIEILCSELSDDGLKLKGEHLTLTDHSKGWQGAGDEGQCLVKHGAYYYHLYSVGGCCDNRCDYRVMVSRARSLKGPWEQLPDPIMQGGDEWRCTGHGTLVTTPDGRYFYLYHAYHATDFEYIGRQAMLDELVWDEQSQWPKFKNGSSPSIQAQVPFPGTQQLRQTAYDDDFSSAKSDKLWQWDLNLPRPNYRLEDGELVLSSATEGIAFLGFRPQAGNYVLKTELSNQSAAKKGICIYGNQRNFLAFPGQAGGLTLFKSENGIRSELATVKLEQAMPFFLKVEVLNGRYYQFFWSHDHESWVPVKIADEYTVDGKFLPQWGVAMRAGLFVEGTSPATGRFSELNIHHRFE